MTSFRPLKVIAKTRADVEHFKGQLDDLVPSEVLIRCSRPKPSVVLDM